MIMESLLIAFGIVFGYSRTSIVNPRIIKHSCCDRETSHIGVGSIIVRSIHSKDGCSSLSASDSKDGWGSFFSFDSEDGQWPNMGQTLKEMGL